MSDCLHPNARTKKYVGSTETYQYCPDCFETFGGEETPAKKELLRAAATADQLWLTPDHDHLKTDGR